MKFLKPKFWENKNSIYSIILIPISIIIQFTTMLKRILISPKKFKIPIICVGNIYLGGTGKTPVSIEIVNELKKRNRNPIIVKNYYRDQLDEQRLIQKKINYLISSNNRMKGIQEAEKKDFNVVILDDGFQDYSIKKDFNIICFHSNQSIGNGLVLPSGPLRENLKSLDKVDAVIINGNKNDVLEKKILDISNKIKIYYSKYIPSNIKQFQNKKLFAFAGIGNPKNFFELLKDNNLDIEKTLSFPDHHHFNKIELQKIIDESLKKNCEIITTEKDYLRIKDYGFTNIKYLEIDLQIYEKEKLFNQILKCL